MSVPEQEIGTTGPPRGLERLLDLQELDLSIDRLRARLAELEAGEAIRSARARAAEAEERLGQTRLELDDVAREQRRLESDIDSIQRKIDAESKRLYDGSIMNAKELQSIEAEVTSLRARRTRMEDELLERMERREEIDASVAAAEAETTEMRERLAEVERESGDELGEVRAALEMRTVERDSLVPSFDPELLELYEDLRRQKKGVGAAALEDGVCGGCRQKLSAVYLDRLKRADGIRRCEYCRRILVFA